MAKRQSNATGKHGGNNNDTSATAVVEPGPTDVLFGRGGHVNHNPANQKYLTLVMERKDYYHSVKKTDKASVAWDIMAELRQQDPPSRFLKKDYSTGLWHLVPDSDVRRKISQCLREKMVPVIPTPKKNKTRRNSAAKKKASPAVAVAPISKRTTRSTRSTTRIQIRRLREEDDQSEQESPYEDDTDPEYTPAEEEESTEQGSWNSPEEPTALAPLQQEQSSSVVQSQLQGKTAGGMDDTALPPLDREPARKRSSYYSLTTGTWKDYNPDTGSWEEGSGQFQQHGGQEGCPPVDAVPLPPPMPKPAPIRSAPESNSRVWSDIFASSLASFTPSIFDFSNSENTWESLLDPTALPQLTRHEDDETSFMGSHASSSSSVVAEKIHPAKRALVHESSFDGSEDCVSPCKKRKTEFSDSTSVDAFFDCESMGLGKVLNESRPLSQSNE